MVWKTFKSEMSSWERAHSLKEVIKVILVSSSEDTHGLTQGDLVLHQSIQYIVSLSKLCVVLLL